MSRVFPMLGAVAVLLSTGLPAGATESPHLMTKPDGSLDASTCAVCHTEDMGLNAPKLETCTLCHAESTHGGSLAHVRAAPEKVKVAMEHAPKDAPVLPLREDGGIYCGTCHMAHDPAVLGEEWLAQGWVPPDAGLPGAVRASVVERWKQLTDAAGQSASVAYFVKHGTRQLRLPLENGKLCGVCHGGLR